MGMTLTEKILAAASKKETLKEGDFILADINLALANDITGPPAISEFEKMGNENVFDKNKIALIPDHFTPNKDIKAANQAKVLRDFAAKQDILHYYEVGEMGIEHVILPEKGIVTAGDVVIGADSHTCTYGAIGAFSTGVGSTDLAFGMSTGKAWFKVPPAIKVNISGKLNKGVSGKDVILHLIGKISVSGALYSSLEFVGDGIKNLKMDDRFTISNMGIEAGAKNAIFEVDEICEKYLKEAFNKEYSKDPVIFKHDEDANYVETININLSSIKPTIAFPHLPDNVKTIDEIKEEIKVDQVVIGSCTNGRINDIKKVADILKGKKVAKNIRVLLFPGSQKVYLESIKNGYIEELIKAGVSVSTPTCGPCIGGHSGVLAVGERAVSTTNRNFIGRMGDISSEIYLASPETAAATALKGYIADPREVL